MDWQIKTMAGKSSLTSTDFTPGDAVLSLIYVDTEDGNLARVDLLENEVASFELPGTALGRWKRTIKEDGSSEMNPHEQILAAEDFFLSLFEAAKEGESEPETEALIAVKHLLALLLERKRVLRVVGTRAREGLQLYRHAKLERTFEIQVIDVYPELMQRIMATMGDVFLQG